jgi:hypothetical protein
MMRMAGSARRRALIALGVLAVGLSIVSAAQASVYCVNEAACVAAGGTPEGTEGKAVKQALAAAESNPNVGAVADEVVIGPGTYSLPEGFAYTSAEAVILRGAGAGSTVLTRPAEAGGGVLLFDSAGSTVEGLTVRIPEHEDIGGLTALALDGGTFARGTVAVVNGTALDQRGGEVLYSTISATDGFAVQVATEGTLRGDRISGEIPLVAYYANPLILEDSVIDMGGTDAVGAELVSNGNGYTEATLRQDAIVGGGHKGLVVSASSLFIAAALEDSVISEAEVPIEISAGGSGVTATLFSDYSSFESAKDVESPETTLTDDHPVAALPAFVSPLTGDFHLAPGSPLIDAGLPGAELEPGEFKTDIAGNRRIVHGRRDVGPYEYQWRAPVATAAVSAASAVRGEVLSFDGAAGVSEPGDTVSAYQWSFDDGAVVPAGASAAHAFTTLGAHTATLTATDAAGLTGTATVTVEVLGEACGKSDCGPGCGCKAPEVRLLHLALSPDSLQPARRGGSVGRGRVGARVSYTLQGRPAKVSFTVMRIRSGVRVGRRCLSRGRGRRGSACRLRVRIPGSFAQAGAVGANSLRFTGRIGGRSLAAGSYVLVASAGPAVAQAPFTVRG